MAKPKHSPTSSPPVGSLEDQLARIEDATETARAVIRQAHEAVQAAKAAHRELAEAQDRVNQAMSERANEVADRIIHDALEAGVADILGQFGKMAHNAYAKVQRECETLMAAYLGIQSGKISIPQAMNARRVLAMFNEQEDDRRRVEAGQDTIKAQREPLPRRLRRSDPSVQANHPPVAQDLEDA
jgi:exonuclease VII small subunit